MDVVIEGYDSKQWTAQCERVGIAGWERISRMERRFKAMVSWVDVYQTSKMMGLQQLQSVQEQIVIRVGLVVSELIS